MPWLRRVAASSSYQAGLPERGKPIHCSPASANDHSRNFVSRLSNWFVFDAGYHTVHHERPTVHWSRYAELHRARAGSIHPSLQAHSVLSFCLSNYVLGAFAPRFRTRPLGRAP